MDDAQRRFRLLAALCGIAGVVALAAYFVLPPPTPAANAPMADVIRVAGVSRDLFFLFAWLQAVGSLLSALFILSLVFLSGATTRFAGMVAQVGAAVLLALALIEGALTIDVAAATGNGHPDAALTSYDQMGQFVHIFPLAPAPLIFVALGAALRGSTLLPQAFAWLALALGAAFAIVGSLGIFDPAAASAVVALLIGQELWIGAAALALVAVTLRTTPANRSANGAGRR
jgi:NADH:ubiquinone oxidoreductase subunit K